MVRDKIRELYSLLVSAEPGLGILSTFWNDECHSKNRVGVPGHPFEQ